MNAKVADMFSPQFCSRSCVLLICWVSVSLLIYEDYAEYMWVYTLYTHFIIISNQNTKQALVLDKRLILLNTIFSKILLKLESKEICLWLFASVSLSCLKIGVIFAIRNLLGCTPVEIVIFKIFRQIVAYNISD